MDNGPSCGLRKAVKNGEGMDCEASLNPPSIRLSDKSLHTER